MHVHSLLWFSAVALLIATVYRRLLGPTWIAGMAAVMYVLDENNFMPVMFIANRNALIALFFGMLSVLAHHRWRRFHSRPAAVAAPLLFLLALFSAEAGLATFAYLFAYAVALERGPVAKRALSLAPTLCVIVLWRIVYNALGYGVANVGVYVDPVNDPVRYALALVERAPLMLTGLLTPLSPDVPYFLSTAARAKFFIGALASGEFAAGEETLETRLFGEDEIPWGELAFPVVETTLRRYFRDAREKVFPFHIEDITVRMKKAE